MGWGWQEYETCPAEYLDVIDLMIVEENERAEQRHREQELRRLRGR